MMKKERLLTVGLWLLALAIICLLAPLNLKTVLPTGTIIAPITVLVAISVIPRLGLLNGALLTVVSQLILLLFNQSDWLTLIVTTLTTLLSGWLVSWEQASSPRLTHQQLLVVGITSGLIILILLEAAYCIVGWRLTSTSAGMAEIARLALPTALLTALCYALLIPPFGILFERLGHHDDHQHPTDDDSSQGSVIIDLSEQKKKQDRDK